MAVPYVVVIGARCSGFAVAAGGSRAAFSVPPGGRSGVTLDRPVDPAGSSPYGSPTVQPAGRGSCGRRLLGQVGIATLAPPEGDAVCTHFLLIGASGSGKGAAVFSHVMSTSTVPWIYQDEKAESPWIRTERGRNAIRWGCAAPDGWPSMLWNPLRECAMDPDPEDAYLTLATVLLPDADGENAWIPKLGRPILAQMLASGRWATLGDLADEIKARAFADVCAAVELEDGLKASLQGRNVSEYLVTSLFSELEPFRTGWGRRITGGHGFGLDDLLTRGGYILGAETEEARRVPIRLMWSMLLRKLMRNNTPRPVTLIMDEAKKAGRIPNFADALVTLRSKGVSIWSAWQSRDAHP